MIESLLSKVKIQELCVGFVNDIDFTIAGDNFQQRMQEILNIYLNLYSATSRYIEHQKTSCYT